MFKKSRFCHVSQQYLFCTSESKQLCLMVISRKYCPSRLTAGLPIILIRNQSVSGIENGLRVPAYDEVICAADLFLLLKQ